ncbi:MAG: anti-sigma F factor [Firmicutes bacterium]|nr:anti-sigma F factor [Bacillota bacterium]
MSRRDNHLTIEMPSRPENVGVARVSLAAFASQLDFTLAELEELKVAVSEAVTNCVLHAYPGRTGEVKVEAWISEGELGVRVTDWGVGIEDVEQARQAAYTSSQDPDHLGLGFTFMENFMDRVEVWSQPGAGTVVTMTKRPRAAALQAANGEERRA